MKQRETPGTSGKRVLSLKIPEDTQRLSESLKIKRSKVTQRSLKVLVQIGKISEKLSKIFGNLSKVFS